MLSQNNANITVRLDPPNFLRIISLPAKKSSIFLNALQNRQRFLTFQHCVKSVRILSYSGSYFPAFGLNTERYGHRIKFECRKLRTRITPDTDTFHAVQSNQY